MELVNDQDVSHERVVTCNGYLHDDLEGIECMGSRAEQITAVQIRRGGHAILWEQWDTTAATAQRVYITTQHRCSTVQHWLNHGVQMLSVTWTDVTTCMSPHACPAIHVNPQPHAATGLPVAGCHSSLRLTYWVLLAAGQVTTAFEPAIMLTPSAHFVPVAVAVMSELSQMVRKPLEEFALAEPAQMRKWLHGNGT